MWRIDCFEVIDGIEQLVDSGWFNSLAAIVEVLNWGGDNPIRYTLHYVPETVITGDVVKDMCRVIG